MIMFLEDPETRGTFYRLRDHCDGLCPWVERRRPTEEMTCPSNHPNRTSSACRTATRWCCARFCRRHFARQRQDGKADEFADHLCRRQGVRRPQRQSGNRRRRREASQSKNGTGHQASTPEISTAGSMMLKNFEFGASRMGARQSMEGAKAIAQSGWRFPPTNTKFGASRREPLVQSAGEKPDINRLAAPTKYPKSSAQAEGAVQSTAQAKAIGRPVGGSHSNSKFDQQGLTELADFVLGPVRAAD